MGLTTRLATAEDSAFLFRLFEESKKEEFTALELPESELNVLLEMQYRAREHSYAATSPAAVNTILCNAETGDSIGRMLIERQPNWYRIIDIAILREQQNRGFGAAALQNVMKIAEFEGMPVRLSVRVDNRAMHLYERAGFIRIDVDALDYEMEWKPSAKKRPQVSSGLAENTVTASGIAFDRDEVVGRILSFLHEIGVRVHLGPVSSTSRIPGIQLVQNGLRVDMDTLLYPGDLLHEAGHLAVMAPKEREKEFPHSGDAAEEMAALAWSYAAAVHIGIPPEIVFHQKGYRGQSSFLIEGFKQGRLLGQPILWFRGMTTPELPGSPSIYPQMLRWMRADDPNIQENSPDEDPSIEVSAEKESQR